MRSLVWPYRRVLAVATLLLLVQTALVVAEPWPLKLAIDHGLGHEPVPSWLGWMADAGPSTTALVAAGLSLLLVAVAAGLGYVTTVLADGTAELIGADLREAAFARTLQLSPRFHERTRSAEIVTRLTSDVRRWEDALIGVFTVLIPESLLLVGMLVVLIWLDPLLALIGLLAVPPLVATTVVRRRRLSEARREARDAQGRLVTYTSDLVRNVRAVQVFGQHRAVRDAFEAHNRASTGSELASIRQEARLTPWSDLVLASGAAFVLWVGVTQIAAGALSIGSLLVVLTYLANVYGPVRALTRLSATFASGRASRERLSELLASDDVTVEWPDALPVGKFAELVLEDVSFSYTPGHRVLDGIDLRIRRGERVCVVGATGIGKTTLLGLLLRLNEPDQGRILLDGRELRSWTLESLRRRIALVPQDAWLLDGTLRENVTFGRRTASRSEVDAAVRAAMLQQTLRELPAGLDTHVGDGGTQLSLGQRRRVALARALLREADVLLLDEPTSGLDAATEADVIEALDQVPTGTTVITVSHRLGLALRAERLIVLEGGRIVEDGSPTDLLNAGGVFARLAATSRGLVEAPATSREEVNHVPSS